MKTGKGRRFLRPWNNEKTGKRYQQGSIKKGGYATRHNPFKSVAGGQGFEPVYFYNYFKKLGSKKYNYDQSMAPPTVANPIRESIG